MRLVLFGVVIVACALLGPVAAGAAGVSYHDAQLGMTYDEFKQARHPGMFACKQYNQNWPEVDCEIKNDGVFDDDLGLGKAQATYIFYKSEGNFRLAHIFTAIFHFRVPTALKGLTEKYGQPNMEQGLATWQIGEDKVQLREGDPLSNVDFRRQSLFPKLPPEQGPIPRL